VTEDGVEPIALPGTMWIDFITPPGVDVTKHMIGAALQALRVAVQAKGWARAKIWVETAGGVTFDVTWCRVCVADGDGDVQPPEHATVISEDAPVPFQAETVQ
jgi:hypothetical protein